MNPPVLNSTNPNRWGLVLFDLGRALDGRRPPNTASQITRLIKFNNCDGNRLLIIARNKTEDQIKLSLGIVSYTLLNRIYAAHVKKYTLGGLIFAKREQWQSILAKRYVPFTTRPLENLDFDYLCRKARREKSNRARILLLKEYLSRISGAARLALRRLEIVSELFFAYLIANIRQPIERQKGLRPNLHSRPTPPVSPTAPPVV